MAPSGMISAKTRFIAHLGVPTESFKAPMICNPRFAKHGIDAVVVPMGCRTGDYPQFLKLLLRLTDIHGALVTMPHEVTSVGLLDVASAAVRSSVPATGVPTTFRLIIF